MVRTSARTTYRTLLRIKGSAVQKVCVTTVRRMLLQPLGALMRSHWAALVEAAHQGNQAAFRQAAYDEEEPCMVTFVEGSLLLCSSWHETEAFIFPFLCCRRRALPTWPSCSC